MTPEQQQIHDMIQTFDLCGHPELVASRILDILQAMNERLGEIEARLIDVERKEKS